ncbi:MAG: alpha-amylase family glycosyl hydrolase [Candidatus Binatia bacterium]
MDATRSTFPWWKEAVFYQIYPRSFAGTTGSGVGDLAGVLSRLDYLCRLGIDAIWLSPFYPSPMHDFGYDVADYCDVDPIFGSMKDAEELIEAVHDRGMRIIIDWVPGHTSLLHPWFVEARSSRTSPRRDWYIWRDPSDDGGCPNNWIAAFGNVPAWTFDEGSGQYYLHSFLAEQPDLNWSNPEVREAMHGVLRFWLDRGVDGFRADVVHNIGKDSALADVGDARKNLPRFLLNEEAATHGYLREVRSLLDGYPGERMMVGEVVLFSIDQMSSYYGQEDELHLVFNFRSLYTPWEAREWGDCIADTTRSLAKLGAWPAWAMSNHDLPRQRTRFGSEACARAAALMLLTLRGTPFLYMGEELGLEDAEVPQDRRLDPGGRDGCRAPIPWNGGPLAGWPTDPWLPFPPDADKRNAAEQSPDQTSMLSHYRALLRARRGSVALRRGSMRRIDAPGGVLAYQRMAAADSRTILINFSGDSIDCEVIPEGCIEVASDGARETGARFDGRLGPYEALLLRPLNPRSP